MFVKCLFFLLSKSINVVKTEFLGGWILDSAYKNVCFIVRIVKNIC